jgi:hypothetical protein
MQRTVLRRVLLASHALTGTAATGLPCLISILVTIIASVVTHVLQGAKRLLQQNAPKISTA